MKPMLPPLLLLLLTGCVAGQNIRIGGFAPVAPAEKLHLSVAVTVSDQREYVLSGRKNPAYIGHYRAGFGNTWDVTTAKKQPLAALMQQDLTTELTGRGYDVAPTQAQKQLKVEIVEWNFDTYMNGRFWYTLDVEVLDRNGRVVSRQKLEESREVAGSFWTGAKYAFEKALPKIYVEVLGKVADVLRQPPGAAL